MVVWSNAAGQETGEELRQKLGILSVIYRVRLRRLKWFGYVEWKDEDDVLVSACRDMLVAREKGRGGGRKTWKECISDDMRKIGMCRISGRFSLSGSGSGTR